MDAADGARYHPRRRWPPRWRVPTLPDRGGQSDRGAPASGVQRPADPVVCAPVLGGALEITAVARAPSVHRVEAVAAVALRALDPVGGGFLEGTEEGRPHPAEELAERRGSNELDGLSAGELRVLELSALLASHPSGHVVVCLVVMDRNCSHRAPPVVAGSLGLAAAAACPFAPQAAGSEARGPARKVVMVWRERSDRPFPAAKRS